MDEGEIIQVTPGEASLHSQPNQDMQMSPDKLHIAAKLTSGTVAINFFVSLLVRLFYLPIIVGFVIKC